MSVSWKEDISNLANQPKDNISMDNGGTRVFFDTDVQSINSTQEIINNNADLNDNFFEGVSGSVYDNIVQALQEYRTNCGGLSKDKLLPENIDTVFKDYSEKKFGKAYFWNESITSLIALFDLYFSDYSSGIYEKEDGTLSEKTVGDIEINGGMSMQKYGIRYGDAGNSFVTEDEMYGDWIEGDNETYRKVISPWVVPWYNIDGDTYKLVRGTDRNGSVLANGKELQFTRQKGGKQESRYSYTTGTNELKDTTNKSDADYLYLRLLMPKNKRRVEVEDLNRNFWVIGQVLASISAFLFDKNGPINDLLGRIINEIMQLWENMLLLWTNLALKNKRYFKEFHNEVVYLDNDVILPYLKFDNFTKNVSIGNIDNLVEYIKPKLKRFLSEFKDYNLAIAPSIRLNNYEENRYSQIFYPGVFIYNRNKARNNSDYDWEFFLFETSSTEGIFIDIEAYENKLYGISETETDYMYYAPFSKISSTGTIQKTFFYALMREQADLEVTLNNDSYNIKFNLEYYDAAYNTIYPSGGDRRIFKAYYSMNNNKLWSSGWGYGNDINEMDDILTTPILAGYYQGEVLSIKNVTELSPLKAVFEPIPLQPLVDAETIEGYTTSYSDKRQYFPHWENGDRKNKYTFKEKNGSVFSNNVLPPKSVAIDWIEKNTRLTTNSWIGKNRAIIGKDSEQVILQYYQNKKANDDDLIILMGEKGYATGYSSDQNKKLNYYLLGDDNKLHTQYGLWGNDYGFNDCQGIGIGLLVRFPKEMIKQGDEDKIFTFSDFFHSTNYFDYIGKKILLQSSEITIPEDGSGIHNYQCELFVNSDYKDEAIGIKEGVIKLQIVSGYGFLASHDPVKITSGFSRRNLDKITVAEAKPYTNTAFIPLVGTYIGKSQYSTAMVCGITNVSIAFNLDEDSYDFIEQSYRRYINYDNNRGTADVGWKRSKSLFYHNTNRTPHSVDNYVKYSLSNNRHGCFFDKRNGLLQTSYNQVGDFLEYPNNGAGGYHIIEKA